MLRPEKMAEAIYPSPTENTEMPRTTTQATTTSVETDANENYEEIPLKDGKVKKVFTPKGHSVRELSTIRFPKRIWLIDKVIPPGVVAVIADFKTGKTVWAYQLSIATATGGTFLGKQVTKGTVVYFDLESTYERVQERLEGMGADPEELDNFIIITEGIESLQGGLEDQLMAYKNRYPDLRLVVIDTLSKVFLNNVEKNSAFMEETKIYGALRKLAQELGITVILIHHKTKMNESSGVNPLSLGYGSNALPANSDVIIGMYKKEITDTEVRLIGSGNDIESFDILCQYKDMEWSYEGTSADQESRRKEEEFLQSSQYRAVKIAFEKYAQDGIYDFRPSDLISEARHWDNIGWLGEAKTLAKWLRQHKVLLQEHIGVEIIEHRTNRGQCFTMIKTCCTEEAHDHIPA